MVSRWIPCGHRPCGHGFHNVQGSDYVLGGSFPKSYRNWGHNLTCALTLSVEPLPSRNIGPLSRHVAELAPGAVDVVALGAHRGLRLGAPALRLPLVHAFSVACMFDLRLDGVDGLHRLRLLEEVDGLRLPLPTFAHVGEFVVVPLDVLLDVVE